MQVSEAQIWVWEARAELDRLLARMTPAQQRKYFEGTLPRVKAKTGIELHLRLVSPPACRNPDEKEHRA